MERIQSLTVLLVSDLEKSKVFYQDVLGCEVTDWWALRNDTIKLGFKLLQAKEAQTINPNSSEDEVVWDAYAYADDFTALENIYNEWKQKGATFAQELTVSEFDWGIWKEFAIQDPDGYVLAIGSANKG
ncbi:VOC family protein [Bacillus sp. FJAT-49736]|uniref:VOC family protein n=1 Tax=Bacillus sp. FJAT-49736 TaxID=2833582 RepID=UPI001BCA367E|nr:VOC family protein [Bacillus sp. FJAT-49736]MBS4174017.1 VOC family protein [Bacillus sp. FJAT-49736]